MDGRDPTAAGGDGPVEEDGALSVTAALAKEAAALFQSGRYSECVEVLNQLSQLKEDDAKVVHNKAVAQYFCNGCSNPRKLLDVLDKVKRQSEDLVRSSREERDVIGNNGSNLGSGSTASSTPLYQLSAPNSSRITYADEFDTSIVTLNTAVILYALHDYDGALSRLEPLYQNIKSVDEANTLQICFLLLDIALASQDALRAADVIQYLEKLFGVGCLTNQIDDGTGADNQYSNEVASANINVNVQDASRSDSSDSPSIPENSLARTLLDESLEYETFISAMDGGTPNLGRSATKDVSKSSVDRIAPAIVQLYKVKFLLLTRNLKAVKRELKLVKNIKGSGGSPLLLKSHLEYACGNHQNAREHLMSFMGQKEQRIRAILHNNLGCISHQLGEHHTAIWYFLKALHSCSALRSEKPPKLSTYSQDKSLVIFYNCGLQYLACGKPLVAARCFRKAAPFHSRLLLWLRFAECCLLAQEKGLLQKTPSSSSEEIKVQVIGSGKWRHLFVENINSSNRHLDDTGEDILFDPDDKNKDILSLPFARQCLNKALDLLTELEEKKSKHNASRSASEVEVTSHKTTGSHGASRGAASMLTGANGDSKETKVNRGTIFQSSLSSYLDLSQKENHMIKQAVLADLAYVELSLENPKKALAAAIRLQQLPGCSRMYNFLSRVYAAEAHCHLNEPKEAAKQLSVYLLDTTDVTFPYSDEDRERWQVDEAQGGKTLKPEEARGILYLNIATMFSIEGNSEMASQFVTKALSHVPNNPRAILAAIYVDLLWGKTQDALVKLKQSRHVRFYSSTEAKQ
ncbi:CCR4-NOT transcription complex subunit 10-like isoform X1 [Dioscorea cayenensis subsp. rotundata]|uniref:CCR4-NOT transcription complex subunit 10-like isoform X1 n=1 Tax=Dioscorea cayennensis subsp. rotundata TaxID=55577 RepID=A0AB40CPI0_DIOCR|nr:CCR4-NOT transcription complex subunit 10-like isoform X1 [Dioscorea cayenensis subsp. rotundata]